MARFAPIVDFLAFGIVLLGFGAPLVRSLFDPRGYERTLDAQWRHSSVMMDMRTSGIGDIPTSGAFVIAALHAHIAALWWSLAAIYCLMGAFKLFGSLMIGRLAIPEPPIDPPPSDGEIERRARCNRVIQAIQVTILAIWVYAWRSLVA